MIKRTLYFGNPAYLKCKNEQLIIELKESGEVKQTAIEDIGLVILDHHQITVTHSVMAKLLANNVAMITCDETHHPTGMMLNLDGHTLQSQKFRNQIEASAPLKKQLWQQTVEAKIYNQAMVLQNERIDVKWLLNLCKNVKSGDADNAEAQASVYYWKNIFPDFLQFKRERFGNPPNNLLNYGYAILRACVARSLVGSGLLPTLGIFHRNQYNAYCLADDIMEPYRPYVDKIVCDIVRMHGKFLEMTPKVKAQLLSIPKTDVVVNNVTRPMLVAIQHTTASVARCFEGSIRKIAYPQMEANT